MRLVPAYLGALTTLAAAASAAGAQSLSSKVGEMIRLGDCSQSLCIQTGPGDHQSHYIGAAQSATTELLDFVTGSIGASLARLPISATSGGTTFSFVDGAPVQNTTSAGPIFAERAATLGHGRLLVGLNTTGLRFEKLRSVTMSDLELNLAHQDVGSTGLGEPGFEYDVVNVALDMDLRLQVTTVFATYGLARNVDVSLAVPLVRSSLSGLGVGTIGNPVAAPTGFHLFGDPADPTLSTSRAVDGASFGVGDVSARAKVQLASGARTGMALLADVRLPTGDPDEFHGAGNLSARALFIASSTFGAFSPHVNAGYAFRTSDSQNDAALLVAGFDQLLARWATLAVDLLAEWQIGDPEVKLPSEITFAGTQRTVVRGTNIPDQQDNPIGLSLGGRVLIGSRFTLLANGIVPIKTGGLQPNVAWTVGLERNF